ncbi:signal peptidase I [Pantoea sp. Nvir]|uniref:signal peptidase I n=1 Tax=Pantoea sp. Nvir TaxID=2576760 RepID=UPI0027EA9257|nr:signal peptidase I [Pantoea sp. Nvir]CAJ0992268.1 Signal peptidase I [Pantoea sp. Nvir]
MVNMFALFLGITTLATGVIWCVDRFNIFNSKKGSSKASGQIGWWLETVASFFPVLSIVFIVRSFLYEPFQIPSGSMMPTLLIGDFILVDKFSYGIKNPITQTKLISTGYPQRGDVAVFKYPKDPSLDYIKRIIGLPGDKIVYNPYNKMLTVTPNGATVQGGAGVALPIIYTHIEPSSFIQTFSSSDKNSFYKVTQGENKQGGLRLDIRRETIGNVTHEILLVDKAQSQASAYYQQPGQQQASWIVPQGQYFMMGDNRDNSYDSRYWGFVSERNLVGKAVAIWMSLDKQEDQWLARIRLGRIGAIH